MKQKLTGEVVKRSYPKASRYIVYDTDVKGFGLRVFPSGAKSWIFEYKSLEGGRNATGQRITIGKADGTKGSLKAIKAREIALAYRSMVVLGQDPQKDKKEAREAPKVREVAEQFLDSHVDHKRKSKTAEQYRDILERIVIPKLGSKRARELARRDVRSLHTEMKDRPFQANRMLAVVSSMYAFAAKDDLVPEGYNPAQGIDRYSEKKRERLLSAQELERLGTAIRKAETEGLPANIDPSKKSKHVPKSRHMTHLSEVAAAGLRLLLFTGARVSEILNLKWDYVDLERGLLLLPDSKTGAKPIVLNAPAVTVLTSLPRIGVYVIAGDSAGQANEKPRADLKRPWNMVRQEAGLDDVRLHDLRHNFASFGAAGSMGLPIIGKLLGHATAQTTARYAHLDSDPLHKASNAIGSAIAGAIGEGRKPGEVIPLKRKDS